MTVKELCTGLIGKKIEDVVISNGVVLTVDGKKYHFVSHEGETENAHRCVDTFVYIDDKYILRTTAV